MSNNSTDERSRKKGSGRGGTRRSGARRSNAADNRSQQAKAAAERPQQPRGVRLSREELEWARDLWQHGEPPSEIADQLGIDVAQAEELVASWSR
ncbi:MAG: hypothetical protein GX093_00840 [Xanthomonadaceae bacterium]|nr:hypothetical protein [Xanthomonadaceae bacterium]